MIRVRQKSEETVEGTGDPRVGICRLREEQHDGCGIAAGSSMGKDRIETFDDIFRLGLEYLYDAEKLLTGGLAKMAQGCAAPDLRSIFDEHLHETEVHVQRLERAAEKAGITLQAKTNHVVQAMVTEAEKMIENSQAGPLRDAALIMAANQMEHFEIGSYGAMREFAELMGLGEVVYLLDQTLLEERRADARLTALAESLVNKQAVLLRGRPVG
ncbi:MAG: ferritin-like domain-containing protein [Terriglobia bacterium]